MWDFLGPVGNRYDEKASRLYYLEKTSKLVRKGFLFTLFFWFMVGDNRSDGFSYNR